MSFAQFIYTEVLKPRPLRVLANTILLSIIPRHKRVGPARVFLDPDDPVVSGAVAFGVYESSEQYFFQKYCQGNMVLVDVGANIGVYTSLALHNLSAGGHIIAIEPRSQTFSFLERNIAENHRANGPRVDAFKIAAASDPGVRLLFENPDNKADNRLYAANDRNWDGSEVVCTPLDDLLRDLGLAAIDFIKIDVQGYEQQVLRGFKQTLRRSQNVILMTEFWPKGLTESDGNPLSYLEELSELGFELYELTERPKGNLVLLDDWDRLIRRLPGTKYTNLIGLKGITLECLQADPQFASEK